MSTPKGMRCLVVPLASGEAIHVYSDNDRIVLQIRRGVPTEENLTAVSLKVGVTLEPADALKVAAELAAVAAAWLKRRAAEPGDVGG